MRINIPVTPELERYIDQVGYREHPALVSCRSEAATRGELAVMQMPPEQGALLQVLVKASQARRILELGTFTGYSAMAIALALPDDGTIITCDLDAEIVKFAENFWTKAGVREKIDLRVGDAIDTLDFLLEEQRGKFDMILIDADKPGYPVYYERAAELLRKGGILILDDTLVHGRVATGALSTDPDYVAPAIAGIRTVNSLLAEDRRFTFALLPTRDGLTISVRN